MTIAAVAGQGNGSKLNGVTGVFRNMANPVKEGSLLVFQAMKHSNTTDAFLSADCAKNAGTCTLGPMTLDRTVQVDVGGGLGFCGMGIWSCICTGAGSLTIGITGQPSGSNMLIAVNEFTGSWNATRQEAGNTGSSATDGDAAFSSGNATSAGAAVFVGGLALDRNTGQTNTPDGAFTVIWTDALSTDCNGSAGYRIVSSGTTDAYDGTQGTDNFGWTAGVQVYKEGPGTLSAPTPSGTVGGANSVTVGATTDQPIGTAYTVIDSAANLSGVTAAQIKAGQKASGTAALASGSLAIEPVTPVPLAITVGGLAANTLYSYAIVENNSGGDSNIVTGTFTTAVATTGNRAGLLLGVG